MAKNLDTISAREQVKTPSTQQTKLKPEPAAEEPAQSEPPGADTYESLFPEPTVVISPPPSWLWWILAIVIILGAVYMLYPQINDSVNGWLSLATPAPSASPSPSTPTFTPTATPTPSPTPTPTATPLDKKTITLRVLNGTTVAGAAAAAESKLVQAGFSVRTIGNAKQQDYTSTIIYYLSGRQSEAQAVQTALNRSGSTLEESTLATPDMVLVVLGIK